MPTSKGKGEGKGWEGGGREGGRGGGRGPLVFILQIGHWAQHRVGLHGVVDVP